MNELISVEAAARVRYGHGVLMRELVLFARRFPELGLSVKDRGVFARFIDKVAADPFDVEIVTEDVARLMGKINPRGLLEIWRHWLEVDSVWLHILMPRILAKMERPSIDLALWVLEQGLFYTNPSFNRFFVQAVVRCTGIGSVLEVALEKAKEADKEELERIGSACLWIYYDPGDLSGAPPADHDQERERLLRRRLRRRFKLLAVPLSLWRRIQQVHRDP